MLAWEKLNTCIGTDKMKVNIHIGYSIVPRDCQDDERKDHKPFGEAQGGRQEIDGIMGGFRFLMRDETSA